MTTETTSETTETKTAAETLYPTNAGADTGANTQSDADKKIAEDKAASDKAATDKAAADKIASDKAASDKIAADKVVSDKAAADKAEADKIAAMTPEQKAVYEKEQADKKAAEDAAKKDDGEKYTPPDLTGIELPEGIELNAETKDALNNAAEQLGLKTKEQVAEFLKQGVEIATTAIETQNEAFEGVRAGWRDLVAKDPVLSTDDAKAAISKGRDAYASKDMKELLDQTGFGDHPAFADHFYKLGLTVKEDAIVRGGSGDTKHTDAATVMYPSMKK